MNQAATPITGSFILEPDVFEDHRGFFFESYNRDVFSNLGILDTFVQDNHSTSKAGVVRGLHFQYPPKRMSKLVRCTRGRLFDVLVDLRPDSPTFKQWFGVELSEENKKILYIPEGCAHGFYARTDCELLYKCGTSFDKALDGGLAWNDPEIAVKWPVTMEPILSERDRQQPSFAQVMDRILNGTF